MPNVVSICGWGFGIYEGGSRDENRMTILGRHDRFVLPPYTYIVLEVTKALCLVPREPLYSCLVYFVHVPGWADCIGRGAP